MARKQTRRSVSLSRSRYEEAKQEAERRGVSLAALVELALSALVGEQRSDGPPRGPQEADVRS